MSNLTLKPEISLAEGLELYESKMASALANINQKGFVSPAPPQVATAAGPQYFRGELPTDVTALTDDQLGTFMGLLSAWNDYVQHQLAEADTQLSKAKSSQALVEANLRIMYQKDAEGKKRSNPERDDYVGIDRRFIDAQSSTLYWETMWRYTKAVANAAEQSFNTISRRITQRGQEVDRGRREGNAGGGNNLPQGPIFPTRRA